MNKIKMWHLSLIMVVMVFVISPIAFSTGLTQPSIDCPGSDVTTGSTLTLSTTVTGSSGESTVSSYVLNVPNGLTVNDPSTGSYSNFAASSSGTTKTFAITSGTANSSGYSVTVTATEQGESTSVTSDTCTVVFVDPSVLTITVNSDPAGTYTSNQAGKVYTITVENPTGSSVSSDYVLTLPTGITKTSGDASTGTLTLSAGNSQQLSWTLNLNNSGSITFKLGGDTVDTAAVTVSTSSSSTNTSSSGGGGGGGGAAAANDTKADAAKKENKTTGQDKSKVEVPTAGKAIITIPEVAAGRRSLKSFGGESALEQAGILDVILNLRTTYSNVKLEVEKLSSKPAEIKENPQGNAYGYLKIETNVKAEDIEEAAVQFKVEESWLKANKIGESQVFLNRYSNDKWQQLATKKVQKEAGFVHYEAATPGFSIFVITGMEETATKAASNVVAIIVVIILVLVAVVYYFMRRNQMQHSGKYSHILRRKSGENE